jgi:hypothetical protein
MQPTLPGPAGATGVDHARQRATQHIATRIPPSQIHLRQPAAFLQCTIIAPSSFRHPSIERTTLP